MTRHELNDVFLRTSFLQGANATYLAELHARYEEDPASLDPEWRAFFASLDDNRTTCSPRRAGPPGRRRTARRCAAGARRQARSASSRRSPRRAIRLGARMLIRAYRTRGHLAAKLDPLELVTRREHPELKPKTYGFTKADYDRPIYIGGAFGLEFGTLRADARHPEAHLLRPYRRRVHAHLRPRAARLDPGPHRRPGGRASPRKARRRS